MEIRIEKDGNYIIAKNVAGDILFQAPSINTIYYEEGTKIELRSDFGETNKYLIEESTEFKDAVGGALTGGVLTWIRANTGFNTASGGSEANIPTVYPTDFGAVENDITTTTNLQTFFDYVRDNNVVGDWRGEWEVNATILIDGIDKRFICGKIFTLNNIAVEPAVSIETTNAIYEGEFGVEGSSAAAYSGKVCKTGMDFTNSGSRNSFENVRVTGFTGYGINMYGIAGSTILENFKKIKITACGSTGSTYTTGSASAVISAVVNSGSANSVNQTSVITVDAVDPNWVDQELLEINGKVHTIVGAPAGLDITVYPWIDDTFTGTIYGLHGGLLVAGSDSASVYISQIDAIRCGSGARLGGLYGTHIGVLQTQSCAIGLTIGNAEESNNLGSRIDQFYNEGSNLWDFVQVSRVNTNTLIQQITGMNEANWFILEAQPLTFDATARRIYTGVFDLGQWHTRKLTEFPKNGLIANNTTLIGNHPIKNEVTILDNTAIFELEWDDAYNSLWGKDTIDINVFGTGTDNAPTNVTFNLNSADQTAGIRINDNGTPVTTKVYSGFSNALKIKLFFDYANQEWNISYKGEAPSSVAEFTITNPIGGILNVIRDDSATDNTDVMGGLDIITGDGSFAGGDEKCARFLAVADGDLGVGSNSKIDLVWFARQAELQSLDEQVRITSAGHLKAKKLGLTVGFTVATLPTGAQGDMTFVTDALTPTYLSTVVGGGAVVCPVFYDGTNWVCH